MNLATMNMSGKRVGIARRLRVGELVEVRSKEEILATLDADAGLEGLPFMPEMFRYCGMRFRVYKRAHKSCDTVFPIRSRRMENAVHLETRCGGEAHGGCQAGCLIFWKEAWLKRVNPNSNPGVSPTPNNGLKIVESGTPNGCTEDNVWRGTQAAKPEAEEPTYVCQATRLPYATSDLQWWDVRQYLEDYRSGNVGAVTILTGLINASLFRLSKVRGIGWRLRRLYDGVMPRWGGTPWPTKRGSIEPGQPTPIRILDLQPGELVRVKPFEEILQTVNTTNLNRGMSFDKEMVPYCGGEYRVLRRVSKIIDEKTGKMMEMKTPSIVLDSVICQARYSNCRRFCPRSIYPYWREIWLERLPESATANGEQLAYQASRLNGSAVPNGSLHTISGISHNRKEAPEGVRSQ